MNLPPIFLKRLETQLGAKEFSLFVKVMNDPAVAGIRIHKGETLYQDKLGLKIPWHQLGYYVDSHFYDGHHPYHHAGAFYFQEPSAMIAVPLLDIQSDDIVLDLAAAPGGKSTDIASHLGPDGLLIANDIDAKRAQILMHNVERMGLSEVIVTQHDPQHLPVLLPHYFDKILLDAPCSGEGMFRKDAGAIANWSPEHVETCAVRQEHLLEIAVKLLKPGGRIVYSTCTFSPQENEQLIQSFLTKHREFTLINPTFGEAKTTHGFGAKLWPHQIQGEGHYVVALQHQGEKPSRMTFTHKMRNPQEAPWVRFAESTLKTKDIEPNFAFEERLFMIPKKYQFHRALHTLRAGVFMGEVDKNIFYPSHHLAHVLTLDQVNQSINFSPKDSQLLQYLRGEELPTQCEDGWVLIAVDGMSLGWGKASKGRLKNHYPKGLRLNQTSIKH